MLFNHGCIMDDNSKKSKAQTFDELSVGISREERQKILNSMDSQKAEHGDLFAGKTKMSVQKIDEKAEFEQRLKRQSFLQRLFLWIYSIITSTSMEEAFNVTLVKKIAHEVESNYPSLIFFRKKLLYGGFHEKLIQLKSALDFFVPYMKLYESNPGEFMVMVGHVVMPEYEETMESSSNPYVVPMSDELSKDKKNELFQNLCLSLQNIPADYQKEMYQYARAVFWLNEFVKIPLDKILSKFSMNEEHVQSCVFSFVKADFGKFARVMSNYVQIDDNLLAVLAFAHQKIENLPVDVAQNLEAYNREFYSAAKLHVSMIEMFIDSVPVSKISKVVMENSLYTPEAMSGGENWLELFTEQWKIDLKNKMMQRDREYRKEILKHKIAEQFKLNAFPTFPFRPWEALGSFSFKYDLSLGFVNFFVRQRYATYMTIFKAISMEGQFAIKDNEREFIEAVDSFTEVNNALEVLANSLSAAGEYGLDFSRYEGEGNRSEDTDRKIEILLTSLESEVSEIIKDFRRLCHRLSMLLTGFISDKYVGKYGAIMNLRNMQRRLGDFYQMVSDANESFKNAYDTTLQIDDIENPKDL